MTHPEPRRPVRDRKAPRDTARARNAARQLADRMTELNALAALYAEQWGDTPDAQAERRDLLDRETLAYSEAHAWERAIAAGLAELRGAA